MQKMHFCKVYVKIVLNFRNLIHLIKLNCTKRIIMWYNKGDCL